jgi:hypothetical protein
MIDIKGKFVYISGPITGTDMDDTKNKFVKVHNKLWGLGAAKVCNPIYFGKPPSDLSLDTSQKWEYYMKNSLRSLVDCTTIVMMEGYHISKGARLEKFVAEQLGIKVLFERDLHEDKTNI